MKAPSEWKSEDRAWSPTLDHFMGNPKEICQCGHERQMHTRDWLEGRHRECQGSTERCECQSFTSAES